MSEEKNEQVVLVDQLADFRKRVVKQAELEKRISDATGEAKVALEKELESVRVTDDELRDSIERLRKLRDKTAPVAKAKATKKAVKSMDADKALDLLGDLL